MSLSEGFEVLIRGKAELFYLLTHMLSHYLLKQLGCL